MDLQGEGEAASASRCHLLKFLCCLFCCPPCPGRIAAKLAFSPQESSYVLEPRKPDSKDSKFMLLKKRRGCWQSETDRLTCFEMFQVATHRGHQITCAYLKHQSDIKKTLFCSHGNSCDLGDISGFHILLANYLKCNIFSYDYSGYGQSEGQASEKNLYADAEAAWHAVRTNCGVNPEDLILFGYSIGTVPTVYLASKYKVGGVVLHSAMMSAVRVAFPNVTRTSCIDSLVSIDLVPKITSPVLVIHGTDDEIINITHGQAIYKKCPNAVEPLWIEGAGHDDFPIYHFYIDRLEHFINSELCTDGL